MNEMDPQHLHIVAGLLVAVLSVLFIAGRVFGKFLDDWWDKSKAKTANGNGLKMRVSDVEEATQRVVELFGERHDRLREAIHQNHAAVLAVLTQLANNLDSRRDTEKEIAITLRLIEKHMAEGRR